ncbi:hypothetical protein BGAL_0205g00010 [Botrytis galanthina]|uniref:Uncharacterized protein n=1 Tax=Botrytis galanthina TaxID=278940 RepID=A0A4S8R7J3_9HELO|nr:hypothetical protein BGAL_0205g00010 [Botrytis galanthina]
MASEKCCQGGNKFNLRKPLAGAVPNPFRPRKSFQSIFLGAMSGSHHPNDGSVYAKLANEEPPNSWQECDRSGHRLPGR